MSRVRFLLLLACLVAVNALLANPITESRAREIASRFMATQSPTLKLAAGRPTMVMTPVTQQSAFYVFNAAAADKGFVIVAGDDRLPPVLGYSDSGSFDADDVPPAMQEWLDGYAAQIEAIAAGATPEIHTNYHTAIEPMLPVHWGQGMPYNVLFPHINGSIYGHAYVGCVAVAMAQIMAYWQYPQRPTTTIPGYISNSGQTNEVTMQSLEPIDFDWGNMHSTYYTNDSTSDACMAVANLMLYSTTSLNSIFESYSTNSATDYIPNRLITYFGYKNSAHYISRRICTTTTWEDTIYAELAEGRPVAYGGSQQSSGHAFVIDGCDGEGKFHINWGWEGKSNGYFLLNLLNPTAEGIGSGAGAYGYVKGQCAVIGIEPNDDGSEGLASIAIKNLNVYASNLTRTGSGNFLIPVSGEFINITNVTAQFIPGWALFNMDGEPVKLLFTYSATDSLGYNESFTENRRLISIDENIPDGTYLIKPIYSICPNIDYRPCVGSDVSYIEVTINGDQCTLTGYNTPNSTANYVVNSCTTSGTHNHGKPLTVTLSVTNTSRLINNLVYMFVDGVFKSMGFADIAPGETGDIVFQFTPKEAGDKTITFSLNQSGSPVLYTKVVSINTMPSANLEVSYRILNITDEENRIITADRFSIIADVTNNGAADYDEDFSACLLQVDNDNTNSSTNKFFLTQPLHLTAGSTTSLQFDFDHDLIDGWKYSCNLYYYSDGWYVWNGTKWYYLNLINDPMEPRLYNIATNAVPAHGGEVKLTGHFIDGKIRAGQRVTITPVPNTGWYCSGVTAVDSIGDPIDITSAGNITPEGNTSYIVVMPESDISATANFKPLYSVTAIAESASGGKVSLSGNFIGDKIKAGETVTITITEYLGWQFTGLTATDSIGNLIEITSVGDNTFTLVMPESDITVKCNFKPFNTVTVNTLPDYGGEVQLMGPFVNNTIKTGETLVITQRPNTGWQFSGITVTDSIGNPVDISTRWDGNFFLTMPDSDIHLTLNYERSTGSLFEFVPNYTDITDNTIYIVANRNYGKVMKHWNDEDSTFQAEDIVKWMDEDSTIIRVNDDVCFFTTTHMKDTTVKVSPASKIIAAYLSTGNGYLLTSNYNVLQNKRLVSDNRCWFLLKNSRFHLHFNENSSNNWYRSVSYDNENDAFRVMNWLASGETSYLGIYKLIEAYGLSSDYDTALGDVVITGGMVNNTAQRGETVTFTVTPFLGYTTGTVQVTSACGEVIIVNLDEATGTYSFIMPNDAVTIHTSFDQSTSFILGDADGNGMVDICDLSTLIDYILGGNIVINSMAADVNEDSKIDIADVSAIIDMLLSK